MNSFEDLQLPEELHSALKSIGFFDPTAIQQKAIPSLMRGSDILACSETGSGKTGAYMIPMLKNLLENPKDSGLVLAPTRELAQQISQFVRSLVPDVKTLHMVTLIGGQDIRKQFRALQKKPKLIVATPGRLNDHLNRNTVQIHKVKNLVLDEGDRMIDMGFAPQLKDILKHLPKDRQTSFFTATLDKKVKELTKKYLQNPESIILNSSRPVKTIKQSVVKVPVEFKAECVLNELNQRRGSVIIFLRTQHRTDKLKKYLDEYGVSVGLIHGGRTQGQRNKAIQSFKKGQVRVLCATDVASRGIDVPQVEHVINFDLPMQDEDYVHRVGRTARNGAEGEAISLVTPGEHGAWNRLVKKYEIPNALLEEEKRGKKSSKGSKKTRLKTKENSKRKSESNSENRSKDKLKKKSKTSFKKKSKSDSKKTKKSSSQWKNKKSKKTSRQDESRKSTKRKKFKIKGKPKSSENRDNSKAKKSKFKSKFKPKRSKSRKSSSKRAW